MHKHCCNCDNIIINLQRIVDGPDLGAWYHPEFLRGKPSSLAAVKRTAVKKDASKAYSTSLVKVQITPNLHKMPPIEMDTPEEAKEALGVDYLPASNGHRGSPPDEDGMLHQFANTQTSKNIAVMAGQAIIHNPNCLWPNPALAMQISSWTGTSLFPMFMYPHLNQLGCAGYPSLLYGFEGQSVPALKSEEIQHNGVASRDQAAVSQISTTMPNSNGNLDGLKASATILGTDDLLVTKAIQYAFKDVPSLRMMTQDNVRASVQHPMEQCISQDDCSTFDSIQYQQDWGISSVDSGIGSFSTCAGFPTSSLNEDVSLNQIFFNSKQQPPDQWEYLEEDDELVQFINDSDEEWI
jgi:hypothetical protein